MNTYKIYLYYLEYNKLEMLNDKYNYVLNGIEHEIILNHQIKIDQKPVNDVILVSNKYMIKYINDLLDYNNIEFCLTSSALLGVYIFNGINIFNQKIEICTSDSNFFKLKKLEDEIKNDGFNIEFNDKNIIISTFFFNKIKTVLYIYPLTKDINSDILRYTTIDNNIIENEFYDIYPIRKNKFEEFEVSIPNKINKVLESYNFNLNYIYFSKKKDTCLKKIIEEVEVNKNFNTILKENFNSFISIIKPFFYNTES
jgi:hypothetical protein